MVLNDRTQAWEGTLIAYAGEIARRLPRFFLTFNTLSVEKIIVHVPRTKGLKQDLMQDTLPHFFYKASFKA